MHSIGILGLGTVGLINLCCFSEMGFPVMGLDVPEKIESIQNNCLYVYEPSLCELFEKNRKSMTLTSCAGDVIRACDVLIICVGTPPDAQGRTNLSQLTEMAEIIGTHINDYKLIIQKSTVPAGTTRYLVRSRIKAKNPNAVFDVAMNPEFLREGYGIYDFFHPDRIVWGTDSKAAREAADDLFAGFSEKILHCSIESAELIKQASNLFLATKICFINLISDLCEAVAANVGDVAKGIGADTRIGSEFLQPGIGFGGSCLSKDARSLEWLLKEKEIKTNFIESVLEINERRVEKLIDTLLNKKLINEESIVSVFGITFKEDTNDCRESQILRLIETLSGKVRQIRCYDSHLSQINTDQFKTKGNVVYTHDLYDAVSGSDLLILGHGDASCRGVDFQAVAGKMKRLQLFNCMRSREFCEPAGFSCYAFGVRA